MALAPGSRLGPYEVTALIGQGGMGEVYRAHDTKLDRDVALKVLPDLFANDPERLARFQREAKVLASLNHPNIASIYGLEEADGVRALVLELVEGPTLAELIAARTGRAPAAASRRIGTSGRCRATVERHKVSMTRREPSILVRNSRLMASGLPTEPVLVLRRQTYMSSHSRRPDRGAGSRRTGGIGLSGHETGTNCSTDLVPRVQESH